MSKLTWRDHLLMVVTTFVVANVRHLIQYHKLAWADGILTLIGSLIAHYTGLFIICCGVIAVLHLVEKGYELDVEKIIRYVFATALVIALAALFIFALGGGEPLDEEYLATVLLR